jgi:hypothetical protein
VESVYLLVRNEGEKRRLYNHLKSLTSPYVVITRPQQHIRSMNQNAFLWGVVYREIADFTGYTTKEIHEYYKDIFLPKLKIEYEVLFLGNGSISDLSVKMFAEYTEKVMAHAFLELGIIFPEANEEIPLKYLYEYE